MNHSCPVRCKNWKERQEEKRKKKNTRKRNDTHAKRSTIFWYEQLLALTIGLGGVVALVDDQVLRAVVLTAGEVAVQDLLGALGIADLSIDGSTGHVRNHGVTAAPWVLGVAERVILGSRLREPDISTVSAEVARLEGLSDIFLDHNGTTGSVHEPRARLHLSNELLVEETLGAFVERAVDSNNVTLGNHVGKVLDTAAANFLLGLGAQSLVVVVEELLAVEGLQTAKDTLANTANTDSSHYLVLKVEFVLGHSSNIPLTIADLVMGGDKVANEGQNGHQDMFGHGHDVGASNLCHGDATVGLVGGVQIDVIGANTGSDGNLQVLGLGEALGSEITGVEAVVGQLA